VFVPYQPLRRSLIFEGNLRKDLSPTKNSYFIGDEKKKFYSIDSSSQCHKTFSFVYGKKANKSISVCPRQVFPAKSDICGSFQWPVL
jgi:hypothetical protein